MIIIRPLEQADIAVLSDRYFPWTTREATMEKWSSYFAEQKMLGRLSRIIEENDVIVGYGHLLLS